LVLFADREFCWIVHDFGLILVFDLVLRIRGTDLFEVEGCIEPNEFESQGNYTVIRVLVEVFGS